MMEGQSFKWFLRQIILDEVGWEGQQRIMQSRVLIIGAGGIGCPALTYLQRAGIGTIGIADFDVADNTNLHRQFLYDIHEVGISKIELLKNKIKKYDFQNINYYAVNVCPENLPQLLSEYDIILDGTDNFSTRYAVNDVCTKLNKPLISASILGFQIQLFVFPNPLKKNLRSLFPEPPEAGEVPSCSENGVLGPVAGMAGMMASNEVLKFIISSTKRNDLFVILDSKEWKIENLTF